MHPKLVTKPNHCLTRVHNQLASKARSDLISDSSSLDMYSLLPDSSGENTVHCKVQRGQIPAVISPILQVPYNVSITFLNPSHFLAHV